jgi:predicted site-specific integrase-resolvase
MVFTAAQAAVALQLSEDTVWRLVKRGVLPRVPHLEGKLLIPREAVSRLVGGSVPRSEENGDVTPLRRNQTPRRRSSGGP